LGANLLINSAFILNFIKLDVKPLKKHCYYNQIKIK